MAGSPLIILLQMFSIQNTDLRITYADFLHCSFVLIQKILCQLSGT